MKKTLKMAVAASVLVTPAFATTNMENPLFMPKAGQTYSKTGVGVMYKEADSSLAMQAKNHAGATEFPIYRISENVGYGITDRLAVRGSFGWTQDDDIGRKGMHEGRVGLDYRVLDGTATNDLVLDVYADAFLGGVSPMKATLVASPNPLGGTYPLSFNYDNYANGRWGAWFGAQVGKTWGDLTLSAFAEVERTFGNDNTEITIGNLGAMNALKPLLPSMFSVTTKSTWEYAAGVKSFYEIDDTWGISGGFTYKHRAPNVVESVNLANPTNNAIINALKSGFTGTMNDKIDEYILSAAVSYKLTDTIQTAVYGEYTFDDAQAKSQNGTDVKVEGGVRVNVLF